MVVQDLNKMLKNGTVNCQLFSSVQLKKLRSGSDKISDLKWHPQDLGRMQLVPTDKHKLTGHIGGEKISKGK